MTWDALANIFQGVTTLIQSFSQDPKMAIARIGLIGLGLLLVYMGKKGYLEALLMICLLYTSDAADDLLCVDLGGRRIIKKKNHNTTNEPEHISSTNTSDEDDS